VHFAHLVGDAGVEKDALGGRGLAGINVSTDADVAIPIDGSSSGIVLQLRALRASVRDREIRELSGFESVS
jgi:hypothetical protein